MPAFDFREFGEFGVEVQFTGEPEDASPPSSPPSSASSPSDDTHDSPRPELEHEYDPEALVPGTLLPGSGPGSGYELVRALGRGGFSAVWLARPQGEHAARGLVALKLAPRGDAVAVRTFRREAAILEVRSPPPLSHRLSFSFSRPPLVLCVCVCVCI